MYSADHLMSPPNPTNASPGHAPIRHRRSRLGDAPSGDFAPLPTRKLRGLQLSYQRFGCLLAVLLALLPACPLCAKPPTPIHRILLDDLGLQPATSRFLLAGSSMLTLHYVDETHLLVTFSTRRLLRRIPGDPPTDIDHDVDALLLELPSGRILARAEWLLHDHGQYLWNLGRGNFILRVRDTFTTFAPLANLTKGEAFLQRPFLRTNRHVVALILSPDAGLLTIETTEPLPVPPPAPTSMAGTAAQPVSPLSQSSQSSQSSQPSTDQPTPPPPASVQLNFYRIHAVAPGQHIFATAAGRALASRAIEIPLTPAGMIAVLDQGHQRWAFDFRAHNGKILQLGLYDSTCRPYTSFVSPSEFIAFGCHGGSTRQQLAGFNLRGDEMWEQTLYGSYLAPHLEFAPAAGRFALSRMITASAAILTDTLSESQLTAQTVDVYQTGSGKPLLHVDSTPIARAGQNFTLSADGMQFAVLRQGAIEIYALPPLAPQDRASVQLARALTPTSNDDTVDLYKAADTPALSLKTPPPSLDPASPDPSSPDQATQTPSTDPAGPSSPAVSLPAAAAIPSPSGSTSPPRSTTSLSADSPTSTAPTPPPPAPSTIQNGDAAEPTTPRKPPTLYNPPPPQ